MRESWRTFRTVIGYYPRAIRLVWETSPRYTLFSLLLTILVGIVPPVQLWISKLLIDRIAGALQGRELGVTFDWSVMVAPAVALFIVWIMRAVSQSMTNTVSDFLSTMVEHRADYLLLEKAADLDMAFFETPAFYDQMESARRERWKISSLAFSSIGILAPILSLGGTLALLVRLHPFAVVVLLLTAAPHFFIQARFASRLHGFWTRQTPPMRMANYLGHLLSSRDAVKEIRLFGLHTPFLNRHRTFWQTYTEEVRALYFSQERVKLSLAVLSMLGTLGVWFYAVRQAVLARITIGDVALVFQAVEVIRSNLEAIFGTLGILYQASLFLGNYFSFLDLAPDSVDGSLVRAEPASEAGLPVPTPLRQGIEFRGVSFHYPNAEELVLRDLSFTIPPGASVALVGENGAGKTTLVKLLTRLYDPTEGAILLDGRDLRDYDLADLRHQVGVIFQDFIRYDLSARENIGFGRIEHADDTARVAAAAESGGAQGVVERLPKQYETILGRTFEGGVDLSGGQWQKLALSRAFMREAQILILDEPTASLDAIAEHEVYRRFAELTTGNTTIFISHRFSTVRMAQHILVLHEGRLIEEGSHEALMALDGQYAKMFNTQAQPYR